MTREKPNHKPFSCRKGTDHTTHRCFYIDKDCCYAFFVDEETDINKILEKFFRDKDFISLKEYRDPEWNHIGFVDYFPETNEIFLSTDKKYKNLINSEISSKTLYKETQKKLADERKIKEEKDAEELAIKIAEENRIAAEKNAKKLAKEERKREKEAKARRKADKILKKSLNSDEAKEIKSLQQDVQEVENVIQDIEEIKPKPILKTGTRSLI